MPLIKIHQIGNQSAWALWYISETEDEISSIVWEKPEAPVIHPAKRLEWMAGRLALQQLTQHFELEYQGIIKDEFGKPYLKNLPHHISLSHSFPYVAAQIDYYGEIGIDLEQPKSKLLRIAHRILDAGELNDAGTDLIKHCVYWCAKESMYKVYGKKGLFFSDHLHVEPFTLKNSGDIQGRINFDDDARDITMTYVIQPDYVLVHTKTQV